VMNQLLEVRIDAMMARTKKRPMVTKKIEPTQALIFAATLGIFGFIILLLLVNTLTAILTLATLIGYAGVYTLCLKYATPQNIVLGGLAGAAPPLLGWTAVTGAFAPESLMLVLIIYTWTPPHFWALAIYRCDDYRKANIPMLPVTHGIQYTKLHILLYTILLTVVTTLPYVISMSGWLYLLGASALNARFLYWAIKLLKSKQAQFAMQAFRYSITYLMLLFLLLLLDHYLIY
ncbi:MAG: heme o synthase, partial [Gammaproteobacteria bacterium]